MRYIAEAHLANGEESARSFGVGMGRHPMARKYSALGEAVERLHFVHSRAHRLCPADELDGSLVNFAELGLTLNTSADRDHSEANATAPISWSLATDLASGQACWVPHERRGFIQHGYRPTTSGWATHETGRAELAALLELIERDAALLSWYSGDFGQEIVSVTDDIADALRRQGLLIRLFLLTKDIGIPVVWAWAQNYMRTLPIPWGASVMSAAAALSPADAIKSSIDGVVQKLESFGPESCVTFSGTPSHPREHVFHYLNEAAGRRLASWVGVPATVKASQLDRRFAFNDLHAVAQHLADRGYRPLIVDETQHYARKVQVSVCRAVVPGLLPLSFGASANARISRLAERLQAVGLTFSAHEVAALPPHPFA